MFFMDVICGVWWNKKLRDIGEFFSSAEFKVFLLFWVGYPTLCTIIHQSVGKCFLLSVVCKLAISA